MRRLLSALLVVALVFGSFPMTAWAAVKPKAELGVAGLVVEDQTKQQGVPNQGADDGDGEPGGKGRYFGHTTLVGREVDRP